MEQEFAEQQQAQAGQSLIGQAGQLMSSPQMDPTKNPALQKELEQPPE
jgi:hypothetical protein